MRQAAVWSSETAKKELIDTEICNDLRMEKLRGAFVPETPL